MIRSRGAFWDGRPQPRCTPWFGDGYPSATVGTCDTVYSTMSAADGRPPGRLETLLEGAEVRTPLEAASSRPSVRAVRRRPHSRPIAEGPPCRPVSLRTTIERWNETGAGGSLPEAPFPSFSAEVGLTLRGRWRLPKRLRCGPLSSTASRRPPAPR
jgi:hypothetical protein